MCDKHCENVGGGILLISFNEHPEFAKNLKSELEKQTEESMIELFKNAKPVFYIFDTETGMYKLRE